MYACRAIARPVAAMARGAARRARYHACSFVHGDDWSGDDGMKKLSPATGKPVGDIVYASQSTVDHAVESSAQAQREWASLTGMERGRIMRQVASDLRSRAKELGAMEVEDVGKPIGEATAVDVATASDALEFFAGQAPTALHGEYYSGFTPAEAAVPLPNDRHTNDAHQHTFGLGIREPLGVCAGIGAWNYPLQIACWKAAPALACGNSFVFKPSEHTPQTALELARAFEAAGAPRGLVNVVLGDGRVGEALCTHPGVHKVSFTGSADVGKRVMAQAASTLKGVTLELGGKSPLVIFDDCDLEQAVQGAMMANFFTQGEVCTNGTRVLVQRALAEEFVSQCTAAAQALRVGDPTSELTQIGALITAEHTEKVLGYMEAAAGDGGEILCGGGRASVPGFEGGNFVQPTIVNTRNASARHWREEIFGPFMSVMTFEDEDEAVALANDTPFGLAAGVYTESLRRAHRMVQRLDAGTLYVNNYNLAPIEMPFGGYKQSGKGKENGREALREYSRLKSAHFEMGGVMAM